MGKYGLSVLNQGETWVDFELYGTAPYDVIDGIYVNILKDGDERTTAIEVTDYEIGIEIYTIVEVIGLTPGKYTAWCTYNSGNAYYSCEFELEVERPKDFKWTIPKISGQPLRLSASEWNAFTKKINEFLKYKGKTTINFTSAVSAGLPQGAVVGGNHGLSEGKVISAKMMNEAVNAIASMGGDVSEVVNGTPVTAEFFNNIVDVLNSID